MARLPFSLEQLRRYVDSDGADVFYSQEMMKKTTFGPYKVTGELIAVRAAGKVWLVETKARKDLDNRDVRQKQLSALEWCGKINRLAPEKRGGVVWAYALLSDSTFYTMRAGGASVREMLAFATLQHQQVQETLF